MASSQLYTSDGSPIYTSDGSPIGVLVASALTVECPADITIITPTGVAQRITWVAPAVTGDAPPFTVVCTPLSGSSFSVGTTTVEVEVTDSEGTITSCSFDVTLSSTLPAGCYSALSNGYV